MSSGAGGELCLRQRPMGPPWLSDQGGRRLPRMRSLLYACAHGGGAE
jgi:hypothetical protein